jgi:quinolinate synthase
MFQSPLPQEYADLSVEETRTRIDARRKELGDLIVILGHHYQRDEIIEHADFRGDSYKLCLDASKRAEAKFIIFCGVHFMAESAAVLTNKRVLLPNMAAGCSMADMANIIQVRRCWAELGALFDTSKICPITYINSAANLKGFVGEHGGAVCTSTNAPSIVKWALKSFEKVLFFPDQHLGRNTAVGLGFDPETDTALWDPAKPLGGLTEEKLAQAKFILWKGHCSVHARFNVEQIEKARLADPNIQILVHPECSLDVVKASDFYGSTEYIIRTVEAAASGTSWGIGTEINLVSRLAKNHPDKKISCLDPQICPCSTMYRIHPSFLLWTLDSLAKGEIRNEVTVPERIAIPALLALRRMLEITEGIIPVAQQD